MDFIRRFVAREGAEMPGFFDTSALAPEKQGQWASVTPHQAATFATISADSPRNQGGMRKGRLRLMAGPLILHREESRSTQLASIWGDLGVRTFISLVSICPRQHNCIGA